MCGVMGPAHWIFVGCSFAAAGLLVPVRGHAESEPSIVTTNSVTTTAAMAKKTSEEVPSLVDVHAAFLRELDGLKVSSFKQKTAVVENLAKHDAKLAEPVLSALLEGHLFVHKVNKKVVKGTPNNDAYRLVEPVGGMDLGVGEKHELKKIIINNKMRTALRKELARLRLRSGSTKQRQAAVVALYSSLTPDTVVLLRSSLETEKSPTVRKAVMNALALVDLESAEPRTQLAAIKRLSGQMHSEVHNRLSRLISDESGAVDKDVRRAGQAAIASIDATRKIYQWIETIFFGLSLGFVLVLAAIGLAITFGVMGVINMAHGELMMLGAYATWLVQQAMPRNPELSLIVAIPVAFLVSALVGVVIERGVVRFLYGRPLETLLATFGISLILQQSVRTIFSPLNRAVATPQWMSGQLIVNEALSFTYNRLYIILFSILVFASIVATLQFTTLGLQIRAVAQNRNMARAMGVRGGWIDAMTFALGAGVAGLAGVALSQLTNVGPNLGQSHIVDSFMVVVFGGVGNLWGTLVAGVSLGVANKLLEPFAGAVLAKVAVLVFIILFIQKRPRGLFPQRGRSAEA